MRHRETQAQALYELSQCGGLLCDMSVGTGKSLIALQAGVVLGSTRVVLLVPSSLKKKTERDIAFYGAHFRLPPSVVIVTYESLSLTKHRSLLDTLAPDLIVGDEAHKVARGQSTRTKRLRAYRRRAPHCRFVWLSGTLITRSIKDVAPLSSFALGPGSPYPRDYSTLDAWSYAVDDGVLFEAEPGVLEEFCNSGEHVREGLKRRVRETLGVVGGVASGESACPASLTFHEVALSPPKLVTSALAGIHAKWNLPDGAPLEDPLSVHRALEQVASGYYLHWTWPRGESAVLRRQWLNARSAWNTAVYHKLKSKGRLDSPHLCYLAAESGEWPEPAWVPWAAIRKQCKPVTEAVWISDFLVRAVAKWAHTHRGIVWVDSPDLGARLAEVTGLSYYGGGPESDPEQEDGSRSCILSINAHSDGLNLQRAYGEALYTCVPRVAKQWDQSVGRIARSGQPRDEVSIYIYLHTPELREALNEARQNADFLEQIQGSESVLRLGTWLLSN